MRRRATRNCVNKVPLHWEDNSHAAKSPTTTHVVLRATCIFWEWLCRATHIMYIVASCLNLKQLPTLRLLSVKSRLHVSLSSAWLRDLLRERRIFTFSGVVSFTLCFKRTRLQQELTYLTRERISNSTKLFWSCFRSFLMAITATPPTFHLAIVLALSGFEEIARSVIDQLLGEPDLDRRFFAFQYYFRRLCSHELSETEVENVYEDDTYTHLSSMWIPNPENFVPIVFYFSNAGCYSSFVGVLCAAGRGDFAAWMLQRVFSVDFNFGVSNEASILCDGCICGIQVGSSEMLPVWQRSARRGRIQLLPLLNAVFLEDFWGDQQNVMSEIHVFEFAPIGRANGFNETREKFNEIIHEALKIVAQRQLLIVEPIEEVLHSFRENCVSISSATKELLLTIHPQTIIRGRRKAPHMTVPTFETSAVGHSDDQKTFEENLLNIARTTLSSKAILSQLDLFAELCIAAVLRSQGSSNLDMIQIVKRPGVMSDSYLENGFILDKSVCRGQRKSYDNPRILVADTAMVGKSMERVAEIDAAKKEKLTRKVYKILAHECDIFINAQLICDYPQQLITEAGRGCIVHGDLQCVQRLAMALDAQIMSTFDPPNQEAMGTCERVEEIMIGQDTVIKFSGFSDAEACSIVLRGASKHALEEMERSVRAVLCVLKQIIRESRLV